MQLTYRGHSYDLSVPALDVMVTGETGRFLGQPYACKRFNGQPRPPLATGLTYRGVHYSR